MYKLLINAQHRINGFCLMEDNIRIMEFFRHKEAPTFYLLGLICKMLLVE